MLQRHKGRVASFKLYPNNPNKISLSVTGNPGDVTRYWLTKETEIEFTGFDSSTGFPVCGACDMFTLIALIAHSLRTGCQFPELVAEITYDRGGSYVRFVSFSRPPV